MTVARARFTFEGVLLYGYEGRNLFLGLRRDDVAINVLRDAATEWRVDREDEPKSFP